MAAGRLSALWRAARAVGDDRRVRLEPLHAGHLPAVAAMLSDPDILRFTRVPDPAP